MNNGHPTELGALTFTVLGVPQQQGSKNQFGGESNKKLKPWRADAKGVALEAVRDTGFEKIMSGPVVVFVTFVFPRLKSHYRTGKLSDVLRDDAPFWKDTYPDADKLQRAVGDALSGIVIKDDAQIARWVTDRIYGDLPRTEISVAPLEQPHVAAAAA